MRRWFATEAVQAVSKARQRSVFKKEMAELRKQFRKHFEEKALAEKEVKVAERKIIEENKEKRRMFIEEVRRQRLEIIEARKEDERIEREAKKRDLYVANLLRLNKVEQRRAQWARLMAARSHLFISKENFEQRMTMDLFRRWVSLPGLCEVDLFRQAWNPILHHEIMDTYAKVLYAEHQLEEDRNDFKTSMMLEAQMRFDDVRQQAQEHDFEFDLSQLFISKLDPDVERMRLEAVDLFDAIGAIKKAEANKGKIKQSEIITLIDKYLNSVLETEYAQGPEFKDEEEEEQFLREFFKEQSPIPYDNLEASDPDVDEHLHMVQALEKRPLHVLRRKFHEFIGSGEQLSVLAPYTGKLFFEDLSRKIAEMDEELHPTPDKAALDPWKAIPTSEIQQDLDTLRRDFENYCELLKSEGQDLDEFDLLRWMRENSKIFTLMDKYLVPEDRAYVDKIVLKLKAEDIK
jgi:hypothetical protein